MFPSQMNSSSFSVFSPFSNRASSRSTPSSPAARGPFLGSGSRSQSRISTHVIKDTPQHRIETFGHPLPVQVTEALSSTDRSQHVSVKINKSGWAWLVTGSRGRRLFCWKYKSSSARTTFCKELSLPPTSLYHRADLVCLVPVSSAGRDGTSYAVMSVSPEGIIRYWSSLGHDTGTTLETNADLVGEECHSLTLFQPYGCILATTTNKLMVVTTNQKSIKCTLLDSSSGMFSGISRRMSSFIFGSQSTETNGLTRVLPSVAGTENSRPLFVLSGNKIQKWELSGLPESMTEKVVYEFQVDTVFSSSIQEMVEVSPEDFSVWCLDIGSYGDYVAVLAAVLFQSGANNQDNLYYMLGIFDVNDDVVPTKMERLLIMPKSITYEKSQHQDLMSFQLLIPEGSSHAFLYRKDIILCQSLLTREDALNKIDFGVTGDFIIGAGYGDGMGLFFSKKHGIISVAIPDSTQYSEQSMSAAEVSNVEESTVSVPVLKAEELKTDEDKWAQFKKAFILYCQNDVNQARMVCDELFSMMAPDKSVIKLSVEIVDDYPASDPRWAESIPGDSYFHVSSHIIMNQLQDKLKVHDYAVQFFKDVAVWDKMKTVAVRDQPFPTQFFVCENAEKVVASIALRKIHNTYQEVVDKAIKSSLDRRGIKAPIRNLTSPDLFYREVTRVSDVFESLIEYEEDMFGPQLSGQEELELIISVNSIMGTMLKDAWEYRQRKAQEFQLSAEVASMAEFIPWSVSLGPKGMRSLIMKQLKFTTKRALQNTDDQAVRSQLFEQMVFLIDIVLDGYLTHVESLSQIPEKQARYDEVKQRYEEDRFAIINPFLEFGEYEHAALLAEKYHDFGILIQLCEETSNQDRLQEYVNQFKDKGFSDFLFKWYLDKGKRGQLLVQPAVQDDNLSSFLQSHKQLSWLHDIQRHCYVEASDTLKQLADQESKFVDRKKTLLTLSKLSLLASEDNIQNENMLNAIIDEHNVIEAQEQLSPEVVKKAGFDPRNMPPLKVLDLIELLVGDLNTNANEYDFKKALDLLQLAANHPDIHDSSEKLKLRIWSKAILKDKWCLGKDAVTEARGTVFFKTVELAYQQGLDLLMFLPPLDVLLTCDELVSSGLAENTSFQHLISVGYEQIERAQCLGNDVTMT